MNLKKLDTAVLRSKVAARVPVPICSLGVQYVTDPVVIEEAGCQMIEGRVITMTAWGPSAVAACVPWGLGVSESDVVKSLVACLRYELEKAHDPKRP
ncbi:hypothetical protein GobsT_18330 [Gemmata obscuriglobus]|uniref:Uncharacterized protein n=1 Tax=Gemmata obscuriglobus TaxID=114 RepID=A0A2Z3H650_9BACT|nr:hypothetical protein [Gemmata obscuriglobus]AWM39802.1 hypothetical protein C1280_24210 [Gemmata obscuriglobus]QEG27080.1 hypothetical protein GobsT_18330 [Gemmata obscuriglobus]VTS03535.1 unnamed protein product [Gemmata obscuriglobus UQM 2246]